MSPAPAAAPALSPYQRALDRGFRWLRFEPTLEADYQHFSSRAALGRMRWAAWLAFALYGAFVAIDVLTLPRAVHVWTAPIRLLAIMPGFLLVIAASHREAWKSRMQGPITLAALAAGVGTVAVIAVALRQRYPLPYEGILLVALYIYLLSSLGWWRALVVNAATLIALVAVELAWQSDPQARLYQIVFMIAANVVGASGGYVLEHGARSVFLVQRLLGERARHDGLTGLSNRHALDDHLARVWRQAVREHAEVAIAMVDVDHFKRYNDRYGHAEGDAALQAVARAVGAQARRPLDLAARYGGEEFLVLWYRPQGDGVEPLGESLRAAVAALGRPHAEGEGGCLTVSVGIAAAIATDVLTPQALIASADAALYAAKLGGRNCVAAHEASALAAADVAPGRSSREPIV